MTNEHPVFARLTDEDRALPDWMYWQRVATEAEKLGDRWLVHYAIRRVWEDGK